MHSYRPWLDVLRALAVLAVVHHHTWGWPFHHAYQGVRLFFVISGFLITGILLRGPDDGGSLKTFYWRRALRIFPAYYLTVAFASLVDPHGMSETIWWHLTYSSNVLFAVQGYYLPDVAAHFWSLSVEEQFYLFWPVLIVFLPARWLLPAISLLMAFGLWFNLTQWSNLGLGTYVLLPGSLDALGIGAMLAIAQQRGVRPHWIRATGLFGSVILIIALLWGIPYADMRLLELSLGPMAWAVFEASASTSALPFVLNPLRYIGRISYGIYLYHPLVLLGLAMPKGPTAFVAAGAVTVFAASTSWHFFELPIKSGLANSICRLFRYLFDLGTPGTIGSGNPVSFQSDRGPVALARSPKSSKVSRCTNESD